MNQQTDNAADGGLRTTALFACGKCPDCGQLQPSGTFTRQPHGKAKEPFRVVYSVEDGRTIFVDAKDIGMARATACGFPDAKILSLANAEPIRSGGGVTPSAGQPSESP